MQLIIVGGVAGGASAAARARRLDENATIILVERGPDVSFANCSMPYYLGGEIEKRDRLTVVTAERLRQRLRLDVRLHSTVLSIDRQRQVLHIRNDATGQEYEASYDKLILAPGAAPLRPAIPGIDLPGVHVLRSLQDMDAIEHTLASQPRHTVLFGAGFIGLELAENLSRRNLPVTVLQREQQIMTPFDPEMTTPLLQQLRKHGVRLRLGETATAITLAEPTSLATDRPALAHVPPEKFQLTLSSGATITADAVLVGIGVTPENQLAVAAGLEVGPRGGIRVNESLQTSDPNIYAVGDAIEVMDVVLQQPVQIPLAGPANRQGRLAADHALGRSTRYRGTQGTAIIRIFELTAAMTGTSEKVLKRLGRPYRKVYVHPMHHASYYPGAAQMTLKLLFDPETGQILGAQGVGQAGVDKRIDILAVALQAKMTVYDLEEVELA